MSDEFGHYEFKNKNGLPFSAYMFPRPKYFNARCNPFILDTRDIKEISWENGTMTATIEVGRMNYGNLKRLREYLESKNLRVCSVSNERLFGVSVIRVVVEPYQNVNEGNLSHVLHIAEDAVHDVTGDVFYVVLSELNKHLNDCGELEIETEFDLKDYEFKQHFSTLNPIRCQLRKNGVMVDTVDIWDDYLMIKSDCTHHSLTAHNIAKALNINGIPVRKVIANKLYVVEKWE